MRTRISVPTRSVEKHAVLACSGAKVEDVLATTIPKKEMAGVRSRPLAFWSRRNRIEVLEVPYPEPDVILISIGGNDVELSRIVRTAYSPGILLGQGP